MRSPGGDVQEAPVGGGAASTRAGRCRAYLEGELRAAGWTQVGRHAGVSLPLWRRSPWEGFGMGDTQPDAAAA